MRGVLHGRDAVCTRTTFHCSQMRCIIISFAERNTPSSSSHRTWRPTHRTPCCESNTCAKQNKIKKEPHDGSLTVAASCCKHKQISSPSKKKLKISKYVNGSHTHNTNPPHTQHKPDVDRETLGRILEQFKVCLPGFDVPFHGLFGGNLSAQHKGGCIKEAATRV